MGALISWIFYCVVQINWLLYLNTMFQDTDYEITEDEKIAVFALEYLTSMSDLTSVTSKRLVSNNYVINQ